MSGAERIAAERARQVAEEGYDKRHDNEHTDGELARAAACYAMPERLYVQRIFADQVNFCDPWPWDIRLDKRPYKARGNVVDPEAANRAERIDLLTKAGALIAAEIDRLLARSAATGKRGEPT